MVGDASRLRQVLVNLLSNAVKFTPRGQVLVEVEPQPATPAGVPLRVAVTDSGIGIPDDRLHSLFDAFSQVDASTTRVYGGTGLGLTISQRLVEAMGGQIHVTSTVGEGSEFSFSVLLSGCDDQTLAADDRPTGQLHGRSALVVDDNATNLRILRRQLQGWGMSCACATNPAEALELVAAGARYDLAVIDMDMPGMNGQQLAAELGRLPGSLALPVVLLSSMGGLPGPGGQGEFAAVLTKPVKSLAMHQALATILAPEAREPGPVVAPPLHRREDAAGPPAPRLRILLAEDNPVNQRVGRLMLDKLGHHVDVAANGAEAVQAVHELAYDVVLMDVHMPQMDGLEATRRIRAELPQQRQPRIVAMTASALAEDREACHGAGMDGYLAKPVRAAELAAVLR